MKMNTFLVIINFILLAIGNCGGPLMMRLYYTNGGQRIWFSSFLQTVAFPLLLFPLLSSFFLRRRNRNRLRDEEANIKYFHMKPPLLLASIVTGLLMGLDNYLYSYGLAYIPVSTASLILSAQLGFTALFAFFMVKQKLTAYTVNAVVLLTVGAVVLALNTDGDEVDDGETKKEYVVGFVMTVCGSLLYAFVLPLVEYSYKRSGQRITFTLVVEFQIVLCFVATCFCLVGMIVSGDFKVIAKEAREFKLGESLYYVVVVFTSVIWQSFFVGAIGLIFCASSLVSGIMISVLLPVTVILAVICFHEKFPAGKGVALVLCIWGSVSYFYGQVKTEEKTKANETQELSDIQVTDSIA